MGSCLSRKQKKSESKINEVNTRATFLSCWVLRSGNNDFYSSSTFTSSSFYFDNNGTSTTVTYLPKIKTRHDTDKASGPVKVERCEDELKVDDIFFSSLYCSRSPQSRSDTNAKSTSSGTWTYQSYAPTPLTQVLPQLYLGTENDAEQAVKLIGLGISHVISIVGGGRYKDLYPNHMYIPLRDNGSSNLLAKLDNSYNFAMESQEPGNKLFVHCQLGQNRSASYVIGFLMKSKKLSFYEAYALVKEKRELIHPHKNYIEQLRRLDKQLHKVYSTPENFLDIAHCSKEGIKIMHHNFSKAESEKFKISQIRDLEENEIDLSAVSYQQSQDRDGHTARLTTFYLPDCDDSSDISVVQLLTPSAIYSKSN